MDHQMGPQMGTLRMATLRMGPPDGTSRMVTPDGDLRMDPQMETLMR
jgi:hypothetical protein